MVQCVILAAGEGKRMRPLTGSRPKVMLPVANRPMLEHLINAIRDCGINDFILVVGYQEAAVRHHFGDGSGLGVTIRYVTQKRQRGTGDAVLNVLSHVNGEFLLLNGDMISLCKCLKGLDWATVGTEQLPRLPSVQVFL